MSPEEAAKEVASWNDSKLSAIAWKCGSGWWSSYLIEQFKDAVAAEMERRGLEPHSWFLSACSVCGGKALYRFKNLVFCRQHKSIATAGVQFSQRFMDAQRAIVAADVGEHERLRSRSEKHHANRGRARGSHSKRR